MERIIRHVVGGLLVACVFVVPAVAAEHPNDRAGLQGAGALASTETGTSAVAAEHPNDRAGLQGAGALAAAETGTPGSIQSLRPDGRELPDGVDLAPTPPTIVAASDSFDWDDAGIGLAGGLGLALVLVGALAAAQYTRRMPGAS
jgi:hypothetical protein